MVRRNHFTATLYPLSDPANAGAFTGERLSGRAFIQSVEGDCVNSPLTSIEVGWIGTWHGKGGAE